MSGELSKSLTDHDVSYRRQVVGAMLAVTETGLDIPISVTKMGKDNTPVGISTIFPETAAYLLQNPQEFEDFIEGTGLKAVTRLQDEVQIEKKRGKIIDILTDPTSRREALQISAESLSLTAAVTHNALDGIEIQIKHLTAASNLEGAVHHEMTKTEGVCRLDATNPIFQAADFIRTAQQVQVACPLPRMDAERIVTAAPREQTPPIPVRVRSELWNTIRQ